MITNIINEQNSDANLEAQTAGDLRAAIEELLGQEPPETGTPAVYTRLAEMFNMHGRDIGALAGNLEQELGGAAPAPALDTGPIDIEELIEDIQENAPTIAQLVGDLGNAGDTNLLPKNAQIAEIQEALKRAGISVGKAGADGIVGPDTRAALVVFAQSQNLTLDDIEAMSPDALIERIDAAAMAPAPAPAEPMAELDALLNELLEGVTDFDGASDLGRHLVELGLAPVAPSLAAALEQALPPVTVEIPTLDVSLGSPG